MTDEGSDRSSVHTKEHTWDLASSRSSHLCFVVLQELDKVIDELLAYELRPNNLGELAEDSFNRCEIWRETTITYLVKMARGHVTHAPALVGHRLPDLLE